MASPGAALRFFQSEVANGVANGSAFRRLGGSPRHMLIEPPPSDAAPDANLRPHLSKDELFINASIRAGQTTGELEDSVKFAFELALNNLASTADPARCGAVPNKTTPNANTAMYYARTDTGAAIMQINCTGNYTATLSARDAAGNEVTVRTWTFEILNKDTAYPSNGPSGRDCMHGGKRIDTVPMDDRFECDCSAIAWEGERPDPCFVVVGV